MILTFTRCDMFWSPVEEASQLFSLLTVWLLHCVIIVVTIFQSKYFLKNIRKYCMTGEWTLHNDGSLPVPRKSTSTQCNAFQPCGWAGVMSSLCWRDPGPRRGCKGSPPQSHFLFAFLLKQVLSIYFCRCSAESWDSGKTRHRPCPQRETTVPLGQVGTRTLGLKCVSHNSSFTTMLLADKFLSLSGTLFPHL
jgi:hypothetical protein